MVHNLTLDQQVRIYFAGWNGKRQLYEGLHAKCVHAGGIADRASRVKGETFPIMANRLTGLPHAKIMSIINVF